MSSLDVRCEERIKRSPADTWAYVAEEYFAHHPEWDPAIVGMEKLTDGPLGVGTRGIETRKFLSRQRAEFEVTEYQSSTRFAFRNTTGPFAMERSYTLTPEGEGTLLVFDFHMAPKGPMRLPFPLLRGVIEKQVRGNIAQIPALVEGTA